jgi:hypothetical protein
MSAAQAIEIKSLAPSGTTPRSSALKEISDKTHGTTPRGSSTPRNGGNVTPRSGSLTEDGKNRKSKTLFDDLCGKSGVENAMRWFQLNSLPHECEMSEAQFMSFVQNLTKVYDWEVYEILDILDRRHSGTIEWEAFYILLCLYTAYYSKRLTKFLYKHGVTVFHFLLDPVTKRLTFERFSRLGYLVGLSEDDILEVCLVFGYRKSAMEMMGQEDFLLFYFSIFNTIDTGVDLLRDNQAISVSLPSSKPPGSTSSSSKSTVSTSPGSHGNSTQANQKCVIS